MISKLDKNTDRLARHARVRKKIGGTAERPRFDVYRSNMHIYVQVIDDVAGKTLAAASTVEKEIGKMVEGKSKTEAAKIVGAEAANARSPQASPKWFSTVAVTSIPEESQRLRTAQEKPA